MANTDKGKFMQGRRPQTRKPLPTGRHSKLTPELAKKICDAVRAGNHLSVAARYSGVGESTLMSWMSRGRGESPDRTANAKLYRDFVHDIQEAQAAAEVAAVLHWRSAMPKDWHAAKDYLKVTFPDRWDPDKDKVLGGGAIAGVQVNINTGLGGDNGTTPNRTEMPLETLIEQDPTFLKAMMPLFDAVDGAFNEASGVSRQIDNNAPFSDQNDPNDVKRALLPPNEAESAHDAVFDVETGTWRVFDPETDETDAE